MSNSLIKVDDLHLEIYGFMEHGFVEGFPVIYNGEPYIVRDIYTRGNPGDIKRARGIRESDIRLAISKNLNDENTWVFASELKFSPRTVQRFIYQYEWGLDFTKRQLESITKHCDEHQGE